MGLSDIKEQKLPEHGHQYRDFVAVEGNYVLSPSGLRNFIENRSIWLTNVRDKVKTFSGNTNTRTGSLCHLWLESYYTDTLNKDGTVPNWKLTQVSEGDVDALFEYERLVPTLQVLVESIDREPKLIEEYIEVCIQENIRLCGSIDMVWKDDVITDWKTASKKPSASSAVGYALQLSLYAGMYKNFHGIEPKLVEVYVIVKTKVPSLWKISFKPDYDLARSIIQQSVDTLNLLDGKLVDVEYIKDILSQQNIYHFDSDYEPEGLKIEEVDKNAKLRKEAVKNVFV